MQNQRLPLDLCLDGPRADLSSWLVRIKTAKVKGRAGKKQGRGGEGVERVMGHLFPVLNPQNNKGITANMFLAEIRDTGVSKLFSVHAPNQGPKIHAMLDSVQISYNYNGHVIATRNLVHRR